MNIYEKILEIMKSVQKLQKDDSVSFKGISYKALSEEKVTTIMREKLIEQHLVVRPVQQEWNRDGNITHVDVMYEMVNVDNPEEKILIASCGDGADTQDKGSGKAMTYAFKYMWLRTFALPTGEDPDKISSAELDEQDEKRIKKEEESKEPIDDARLLTITELCKDLEKPIPEDLKEWTKGKGDKAIQRLMALKAEKKKK